MTWNADPKAFYTLVMTGMCKHIIRNNLPDIQDFTVGVTYLNMLGPEGIQMTDMFR